MMLQRLRLDPRETRRHWLLSGYLLPQPVRILARRGRFARGREYLYFAAKSVAVITALVVTLTSAPVFVRAQSTTGDILGVVRDSSGAIVPNAFVKVVQEGTNVTHQTKTNAQGLYEFPILPPGDYTITLEVHDFKKYVDAQVPLNAQQVLPLNVALEVGSTSQTVTVSSRDPLVNTDSSTISAARKFLTNGLEGTPIMTSIGRNTAMYSLLVRDAQKGGAGIKGGGIRSGEWETTVDGN